MPFALAQLLITPQYRPALRFAKFVDTVVAFLDLLFPFVENRLYYLVLLVMMIFLMTLKAKEFYFVHIPAPMGHDPMFAQHQLDSEVKRLTGQLLLVE